MTGAVAVTQIEQLASFRDARGLLFEPLGAAALGNQNNVHVVLTEPDAVRGNHRHRVSVEITTVVGPCLVRLKESGVTRDIDVPAGETWRFTIPPGVSHAYRNTGKAVMLLVSFNSHVHDPAKPDMERDPIL